MGNANSAADGGGETLPHPQPQIPPAGSDDHPGVNSKNGPHNNYGTDHKPVKDKLSIAIAMKQHRSLRNGTQATCDDAASMSTCTVAGTVDTKEKERKQKLELKLKHQQAQAQSRSGATSGNYSKVMGYAPGLSAHLPTDSYFRGGASGLPSSVEENGEDQIRTNRLRTRSVKLNPTDDEEQWQNAWEEDSSSSASDDEEGESEQHPGDKSNARGRLDSDSDLSVSQRVDDALRDGEDAVKWETADAAVRANDRRPNLDMFSQLRVLGKGSFGKVILTQKCTGQEKGGLFAMKILRKSHLLKKQQIERTRTERKVLSIVDHPFIMKLHFAFQTEDKLFLILDYCAGGELFFHLSRHKKFSEGWTRFYTAELLLALGHLHSKGIIYRDLKPENILLDAKGHLKLGDFGLAKSHIRHPYEGAKSRVGTPEYMAPEVIKKQGHGFTVDYWGLGMVTYEMMTGLPPWYTDDRSKIFKRLLRAPLTFPVNTQISPPLLSFIASLLERSPHRRLGVRGVANVKNHPFFRRLDFKALEARRIDAPIRPCEGWRAPEPEKTKKSKLLGMFSSQRQANQTTKIKSLESEEVDAATANFDAQFTRMTLDSHASNDYGDEDDYSDDDRSYREELNANSFVGFTFDDPQNQSTAFDEVVNM